MLLVGFFLNASDRVEMHAIVLHTINGVGVSTGNWVIYSRYTRAQVAAICNVGASVSGSVSAGPIHRDDADTESMPNCLQLTNEISPAKGLDCFDAICRIIYPFRKWTGAHRFERHAHVFG